MTRSRGDTRMRFNLFVAELTKKTRQKPYKAERVEVVTRRQLKKLSLFTTFSEDNDSMSKKGRQLFVFF